MSPDTGMSAEIGVPHVVLRDITNSSHIVSDDNTLWYKNADRFIQIKANMKSYIPLETAAIFFLANLFLKQGIG